MAKVSEIIEYLYSKGFACQELDLKGINVISIDVEIAEKHIELIHFPTSDITGLPVFLLAKPNELGQLAHVLNHKEDGYEFGRICVNDKDSISVNFNMPLLAIEESLNRHIAILKKAITDPEWNRQELLREFNSCWLHICDFKDRPVLLTKENDALEVIDVYRPIKENDFGFRSYYLAQSKDTDLAAAAKIYWQDSSNRSLAGKAVVLPLTEIEPAPSDKGQLIDWYLDILSNQQPELLKKLRDNYGQWRTYKYWIFFNAEVASGKVWLSYDRKWCLRKT